MLEFRLKAASSSSLCKADWAYALPAIDFKNIICTQPQKIERESLDEVDPEILRTYGIPLEEQAS